MDLPISWVMEQNALTALSLITCVLVLLPLPGFFQGRVIFCCSCIEWPTCALARYIGCILYAMWIFLLCSTSFVNNLLWRDHARNIAPIWCDICTLNINLHLLVINLSDRCPTRVHGKYGHPLFWPSYCTWCLEGHEYLLGTPARRAQKSLDYRCSHWNTPSFIPADWV